MKRFLWGILAAAAVGNFLYNCTPPTGEDELIYHVSLPAQWIHAGHWIQTPDNPNAYFPQNGEVLTTLMMKLGGWRLAKLFVWLTGIMAMFALMGFARVHAGLSEEGSLWAAAIFYTMPCITSLNGTVSVDQLNLLWEIMAVSCIYDWNLLGGGFFAGLSLGTRPYSLAWVVAAMIVFLRKPEEWVVFGGIAFILCVPYPIRNWWLTGNPFYPRAFWSGAAQDIYFRAMETEYMPHGILPYLTLPFTLSWGGLIWGCGPIPMLTGLRGRGRLLLFAGAILIITAMVPMTLFNARYFSPLFPWLAVLAAKGLDDEADSRPVLDRKCRAASIFRT